MTESSAGDGRATTRDYARNIVLNMMTIAKYDRHALSIVFPAAENVSTSVIVPALSRCLIGRSRSVAADRENCLVGRAHRSPVRVTSSFLFIILFANLAG